MLSIEKCVVNIIFKFLTVEGIENILTRSKHDRFKLMKAVCLILGKKDYEANVHAIDIIYSLSAYEKLTEFFFDIRLRIKKL